MFTQASSIIMNCYPAVLAKHLTNEPTEIFITEVLTGESYSEPFDPTLNALNHSATDPYSNCEQMSVLKKVRVFFFFFCDLPIRH